MLSTRFSEIAYERPTYKKTPPKYSPKNLIPRVKYRKKAKKSDLSDLFEINEKVGWMTHNYLFPSAIEFSDPSILCLARSEKKIVGYVLGKKYPKLSEIYISLIAVHPDHQKKGIGTQLMKNVFENSSQDSIHTIMLIYKHTNQNLENFYKKTIPTHVDCTFTTEKMDKNNSKLTYTIK